MSEKYSMLEVIKGLGEAVVSGIVEVWVLATIGLLGLLGLFGKRMLTRWDDIAKTHVPNTSIDKRFAKTYSDMTNCQKELKGDISEVKDSVSEVHGRIDDIYHILVSENSSRPSRKEERE